MSGKQQVRNRRIYQTEEDWNKQWIVNIGSRSDTLFSLSVYDSVWQSVFWRKDQRGLFFTRKAQALFMFTLVPPNLAWCSTNNDDVALIFYIYPLLSVVFFTLCLLATFVCLFAAKLESCLCFHLSLGNAPCTAQTMMILQILPCLFVAMMMMTNILGWFCLCLDGTGRAGWTLKLHKQPARRNKEGRKEEKCSR